MRQEATLQTFPVLNSPTEIQRQIPTFQIIEREKITLHVIMKMDNFVKLFFLGRNGFGYIKLLSCRQEAMCIKNIKRKLALLKYTSHGYVAYNIEKKFLDSYSLKLQTRSCNQCYYNKPTKTNFFRSECTTKNEHQINEFRLSFGHERTRKTKSSFFTLNIG